MGIIYKATNKINGKAYIGYATSWPMRRKAHENLAGKDGGYFHNALAKHGVDNFDWFILLSDATLADERQLIEEHGTYWETGKGYNLTRGGEGKLGYVTSEETKRKISEAHKKLPVTPERLRILRENARLMRGMRRPTEVCERISKANKGKPKSDEHRKNISLNHASKRPSGAYYQSPEFKAKVSAGNRGKIRTPEQRERYRQAAIKRHANKKAQMANV
jgi:group I intron endonuclease